MVSHTPFAGCGVPSTHSWPRRHHGLPAVLGRAPTIGRHRRPLMQAGAANAGTRGPSPGRARLVRRLQQQAGARGLDPCPQEGRPGREGEAARRGAHQEPHGLWLSSRQHTDHCPSPPPPQLAPRLSGRACPLTQQTSEGTMRSVSRVQPWISEGTEPRARSTPDLWLENKC